METKIKTIGLNGNQLKILAMLFMTVDHVGAFLMPQYEILRYIGRLAMPIFAFMIAEGCTHTHNRLRYFLTLLGFLSGFSVMPSATGAVLGVVLLARLKLLAKPLKLNLDRRAEIGFGRGDSECRLQPHDGVQLTASGEEMKQAGKKRAVFLLDTKIQREKKRQRLKSCRPCLLRFYLGQCVLRACSDPSGGETLCLPLVVKLVSALHHGVAGVRRVR